MEAAAKTVELLTQRILPDKPHNLSKSPDWRFRVPLDESKLGPKYLEEWDNRRLQYTTFLSEADRGVLLTRPYYDMRIEPPKPVPRDLTNLAKPAGEKKKLSLSDYKNKKTGVASDATPEPTSTKKHDGQRADSRQVSESRKLENKSRDSDHKPPKPPVHHVVDMRYANNRVPDIKSASANLDSLPPKPPPVSLPPRPKSPESRKRHIADDDLRLPPKRSRLEASRASEDRTRTPRDEPPPRRKDRESYSNQDRETIREARPTASSILPNGRSVLKGATGVNRNASPAGRAKGDPVNGVRSSLNNSSKNTPNKAEPSGPSKSFVPPLLSPLHLNLDSHDAAENREKKRAREDAVDGTRSAKPKKSEPPPPPIKRARSPVPLTLPPLLSPTLPAIVEEELLRRKKSPPKSGEPKSKDERSKEDRRKEERGKDERASSTARKAPVEPDEAESSDKSPQRLIVTLKIPKRNRQTVKRILALNPRKESQRKERSASSEAPTSQAKKRPTASSETIQDSISVKRPRPSDATSNARLVPPPSTPSKKGPTAMSRVSSSNSQVNTPGELTTATPSAPGSSDRAINGTGDRVDIQAANRRCGHFSQLGRQLKHNGEIALKRSAPGAANGNGRPSGSSSLKLGCVLTIESIIAFMMSFQSLNHCRSLSGKAGDPACWETLFPLVEFIKPEARRLDARRGQPLMAALLVLHAVAVEEIIKCYGTYENPTNHVSVVDFVRHERNRSRLWSLVRDANEAIESKALRHNICPWMSLEEVLVETIRILRRYCADENVDWTPEVNPREDKGTKSQH